MNLKLEINAQSIRALVPALLKAQPYIFGFAVIAVFAYTAFTLNQSLNVQPASTQSVVTPLPKIVFYQNVIDSLRDRNVVSGDVPLNLGTNDPFKP